MIKLTQTKIDVHEITFINKLEGKSLNDPVCDIVRRCIQ